MASGGQSLAKEAENYSGKASGMDHEDWCRYYRFMTDQRKSLLTDEEVRSHLSGALPRSRRHVSREEVERNIDVEMTSGPIRDYLDSQRDLFDSYGTVFTCNCKSKTKKPEPALKTNEGKKGKRNKPQQNAENEPILSSSGNVQLSEESETDEPVNVASLSIVSGLQSSESAAANVEHTDSVMMGNSATSLKPNKGDFPVAETVVSKPTEESHGVLGSLLADDLALSDEDDDLRDFLKMLPESSSSEERMNSTNGRNKPSDKLSTTAEENKSKIYRPSRSKWLPNPFYIGDVASKKIVIDLEQLECTGSDPVAGEKKNLQKQIKIKEEPDDSSPLDGDESN